MAIVNDYPPPAPADDLWQLRLGGLYEYLRESDAAETLHNSGAIKQGFFPLRCADCGY